MHGSLRQALTELRRRRVFRVAAAYVVVGWLLIQLGSATFEPIGLPDWSMRLLLVLLILGFMLACVLAWAYDIGDRKSTRLNSSHPSISYAVFCLKKKKRHNNTTSKQNLRITNYSTSEKKHYIATHHGSATLPNSTHISVPPTTLIIISVITEQYT